MSPPNPEKPYLGVVATYKCQKRTGKMRLIGTRTAMYLDMKRRGVHGAKLTPCDSDEDSGEVSKPDLAKNVEGSITKPPESVILDGDDEETPVAALLVAKSVEQVVDYGGSGSTKVVAGKKRHRSESPVPDDVKGEGDYNPFTSRSH